MEIKREVDVVEAVEILVSRWIAVVGIAVTCALVVFVYLWAQPQRYAAEALVVLSPPVAAQQEAGQGQASQPGSEIVVPSLAAQTYEVLALGDELLNELLLALRDDGDLAAEAKATVAAMTERSLRAVLEVDLVQQTAQAKSPLLAFRAESSRAGLPVAAANRWADLFVARHRGLTSTVAANLHEWVEAQNDSARARVYRTEEALRQLESPDGDLNLLQTAIATRAARLDTALSRFQDAETRLGALRREREHLRQQLSALEVDDTWLGYVDPEVVARQAAGNDANPRQQLLNLAPQLAAALADSLALAADHHQRRLAFETWRDSLRRHFRSASGIDGVEARAAAAKEALRQAETQAATLDAQVRAGGVELTVLQENLAAEPPVRTLSKAIADQNLWAAMADGGDIEPRRQAALERYHLLSEEVNPTHAELAHTLRTKRVEVDLAAARATFLQTEIPRLEGQIDEVRRALDSLRVLEGRIDERVARAETELTDNLRRERRAVVERLQRKRGSLATHEESYLRMRSRLEAIDNELADLRVAAGYERSSFESWSTQIRERKAAADSLRTAKATLQRELEVYEETYRKFARLVEETRIARERAAGDMQLVSRAVVARRVDKGVARRMALAAVLGGLLASAGVLVSAYLGGGPGRTRPDPGGAT